MLDESVEGFGTSQQSAFVTAVASSLDMLTTQVTMTSFESANVRRRQLLQPGGVSVTFEVQASSLSAAEQTAGYLTSLIAEGTLSAELFATGQFQTGRVEIIVSPYVAGVNTSAPTSATSAGEAGAEDSTSSSADTDIVLIAAIVASLGAAISAVVGFLVYRRRNAVVTTITAPEDEKKDGI